MRFALGSRLTYDRSNEPSQRVGLPTESPNSFAIEPRSGGSCSKAEHHCQYQNFPNMHITDSVTFGTQPDFTQVSKNVALVHWALALRLQTKPLRLT